MKDAFDDLERDLRAAVRSRRRPRMLRMPALALLAALLLGGGGAVAATRIARDPGPEQAAGKLLPRVLREARTAACATAHGQPPGGSHGAGERVAGHAAPVLSDAPVPPEIAQTLPALSTAVTGTDPEQVLAQRSPFLQGAVLRTSVRIVPLAGAVRLTVYVTASPSIAPASRAACLAVRERHAAELATGEVLAALKRRLAAVAARPADAYMLFVSTQVPGRNGSSGVGIPVSDGTTLRTGIIGTGGDGAGVRYTGIAGPGVARVVLEPERGRGKIATVHQGFYSFGLLRGLGAVTAREVDATGATLRTFTLRR